MRNTLIIFIILWSAGCANNKWNDESGIIHTFHVNKNGKNIEQGDFTALTFTERTEEGYVLYNSDDYDNRPVYKFREASSFNGDFFSALGLLSEGDSATFKINLDSIITKTERLKPETNSNCLIYTIKINKVIARGKLNDSSFNEAIESFKQNQIRLAGQNETSKINSFIAKNKLKPIVTNSGLYYLPIKSGNGVYASVGDLVEVNYTAKYLSGKVFETSSKAVALKANMFNPLRKYGTMKVVVSKKPVSGFYEAITLFPEGSKATLIIPSKLAYGQNTYRELRPFTPLLCELEIVKVYRPKKS